MMQRQLTKADILAARAEWAKRQFFARQRASWSAEFDKPSRYKGAHGGRASGKSHDFAERLIERCLRSKTRAVCIREVQNSLKESVRQLIIDKLQKNGLGQLFDPLEAEIRGPHGSLIIFRGMQSYNAETIKSLEGYDIAWIEEAQTLSHTSLKMLRPTIRAPGSEIWATWNPRHDTDAIDVLLRGPQPPRNAIVRQVNYCDNPWLPDEMRDEMEDDRARDPDQAAHIWDGAYEIVSEGAYYAALLATAEKEGRIGDFPYDPALPVLTAWDIGVDDYTAIWFLQENGQEVRAIDYFETSGEGVEDIIKQALYELVPHDERIREMQVKRAMPFLRYGRHFLPHDVQVREWGAGRSRLATLREYGVKDVNVGIACGPAERVNAGRALLPYMRFNKATCDLGVKRLRNYSRRLNRTLETYGGPLHDENSHGADAFGEFAVNCHLTRQKPKKPVHDPRDRYHKGKQQAPASTAWG
jgi:phage terminase large subunit